MILKYALPALLIVVTCPAQAAIYKCLQADGRVEYSSMPCGPTEEPTTFSQDATFSTLGRHSQRRSAATAPPISDYDKRRQRALTGGGDQRR
jgi:hypothetical protein